MNGGSLLGIVSILRLAEHKGLLVRSTQIVWAILSDAEREPAASSDRLSDGEDAESSDKMFELAGGVAMQLQFQALGQPADF
jgi:hypothetical protein